MSECRYLLDTNILLTAYHKYYAFDLIPSFWQRLEISSSNNQWAIIDYVRDELLKQQDTISEWIKSQYKGKILISSSQSILKAYSIVINEAYRDTHYYEYAIQNFASAADSWLVAHALDDGFCVVTEEIYEPTIKRRVKISNECKKHGIDYINTFDFMRKIGINMI